MCSSPRKSLVKGERFIRSEEKHECTKILIARVRTYWQGRVPLERLEHDGHHLFNIWLIAYSVHFVGYIQGHKFHLTVGGDKSHQRPSYCGHTSGFCPDSPDFKTPARRQVGIAAARRPPSGRSFRAKVGRASQSPQSGRGFSHKWAGLHKWGGGEFQHICSPYWWMVQCILYVYFNYSLAHLACMHETLQNPG